MRRAKSLTPLVLGEPGAPLSIHLRQSAPPLDWLHGPHAEQDCEFR